MPLAVAFSIGRSSSPRNGAPCGHSGENMRTHNLLKVDEQNVLPQKILHVRATCRAREPVGHNVVFFGFHQVAPSVFTPGDGQGQGTNIDFPAPPPPYILALMADAATTKCAQATVFMDFPRGKRNLRVTAQRGRPSIEDPLFGQPGSISTARTVCSRGSRRRDKFSFPRHRFIEHCRCVDGERAWCAKWISAKTTKFYDPKLRPSIRHHTQPHHLPRNCRKKKKIVEFRERQARFRKARERNQPPARFLRSKPTRLPNHRLPGEEPEKSWARCKKKSGG